MPDQTPELRYDVEQDSRRGTWIVYKFEKPVSTLVARFFENPGAPIDAETCARMVAEELNKRVQNRSPG